MTRSASPQPGAAPEGASRPQGRSGPPDAVGSRFVSFTGQSFDAATRTVEAVFAMGAQVRRWFGFEELEISDTAIDLARVMQGQCRFLDGHNQWELEAVLGVVESARIENGALVGRVRLADTERGRLAEGMITRGELTGISVGYAVRKWQLVERLEGDVEVWRATEWELLEVSLVSVPADPNAGVRSAVPTPGTPPGQQAHQNNEDPDMRRSLLAGTSLAAMAALSPNPDAGAAVVGETRAADPVPAPVAEVRAAAPVAAPGLTRFGMTEALAFVEQARAFGDAVAVRANELVAQNERGEVSVEAARAAILTSAADHQRAATTGVAALSGARAGDEKETSRNAIVDAITSRALRTAPQAGGGEYVHMRLLEIASQRAGLNPRERDAMTILRAAHTTSDFPLIMEAAANKVLMVRYETASPTYKAISKERNLRDFKATKLLRIGDFPTLKEYQEDGEIQSGTINEGRESVTLASYGRILRLSRQAIINDDLGAFDDVIGGIGFTVARFENNTFFAMKAQNSGLGPTLSDGHTLFKSNHSNYTSSGTVLGIPSLGIGRAAIRKQTDLDGNVLNLAPSILLVGPDNETLADQLTTSISPALTGSVNPFSGRLTTVVEGSITGYKWELYADPNQLAAFNHGYLADSPGPRVMTEEQFNTDGMAFRVTLDFYAGAVDYRPAYHNAGAAS